jgi:cysteine desulfurase/selenocysteine lyase
MLGPTGTGVLWMKDSVISPFMVGGGTVDDVDIEGDTAEGYTLTAGYKRYEAGTPNISGAIGLAQAVKYLEKLGMDDVFRHEQKLTERLLKGLASMDKVDVYGPQ